MISPALDIATHLASLPGFGDLHGSNDWALHVDAEPDAPTNCVTLYDTPGLGPDTDERDIWRPGFQVRVRAAAGNYGAAIGRHNLVKSALLFGPIETSASRFTLINLTSDVSSLGRDERGRHVTVATYAAQRVAST